MIRNVLQIHSAKSSEAEIAQINVEHFKEYSKPQPPRSIEHGECCTVARPNHDSIVVFRSQLRFQGIGICKNPGGEGEILIPPFLLSRHDAYTSAIIDALSAG